MADSRQEAGARRKRAAAAQAPPKPAAKRYDASKRPDPYKERHADRGYDAYFRARQRQEQLTQARLEAHRKLMEETNARRQEALRKRLEAARQKLKDFNEKNKDRLQNASEQHKIRARADLKVARDVQRQSIATQRAGAPHDLHAEVQRLRAQGKDSTAFEPSTNEQPFETMMGNAGARYVDRFSTETTNPEDVRLIIQVGKRRVMRHATAFEIAQIYSEDKSRQGYSQVRGPNGEPLNTAWGKLELDPSVKKGQGGTVLDVAGLHGPYLVSHSGTTKDTSAYGLTTGPRNRKDSVSTVTTPGTFMTFREVLKSYSKLAQTDPEAFAKKQQDLSDAGYIPKGENGHDNFVHGKMDVATRKGLQDFLKDASYAGAQDNQDFDQFLSIQKESMMLDAANQLGSGGGGGGGGGANPFPTSDPALLNMYAEEAAKAVLGRMPTPDEKFAAVSAVHTAEVAKGQKTTGEIQDVDPQASMTEFFRKKAPAESGAKNIADAFDSFVNLLGPGGAAGKGRGVIDQGNSRVGA